MTGIIVGGTKGGTGKSTIATNLAVMSSLMGKDTLLIDTDKRQTSSAKFINHRNEKGITPAPINIILRGTHLNDALGDFSKKYDVIIVDAGGEDSPELRSAMASPVIDIIYSPFKPSEFDLETLIYMDEMIQLSRAFNPDLKAYLLFNQAPSHSKVSVTDDAINYCKDFNNMRVMDLVIVNRIAYQYAIAASQSVIEFEAEQKSKMKPYQAKSYLCKASLEMCELYKHAFNETFNLDNLKNEIIKDTV